MKKKYYFVLEISRFSCFCEIHRFQNLWCHHRHCYIMEVHLCCLLLNPKYYQNEFWCAVWQTSLKCFWLNAGDWELVPSPFMILLKWQCSKIWPFLIIWHLPILTVPYSPFQKNETLESLSNWSRLLNWKGPMELSPILLKCSKDCWKLLPLLILSTGQIWWLNELWFKRYIQKCTLSHVIIVMMKSQTWQIMGWLKIQKL